jgi:NAD(P)-dependent dehydrogenase (short-subunit alcohol dehydrogenase family)
MTTRLLGRRALVTGAASGVGRATVHRFADEGATVVAVDLHEPGLQEMRRGREDQISASRLDIRDGEAEALIERESIDILVNAAGILRRHPPLEHPLAVWSETLDVNLKAAFRLSRAFARLHVERGSRGAIVNVSSVEAFAALPAHVAYTASKAGIMMLTRAFALELAEHGIRVNAVAPGVTATGMNADMRADPARAQRLLEPIPMRRFAQPEEQAAAIAFLASEDASYMTGSILPVDGGWLSA